MNTKELIKFIEDNGGLNTRNLRSNYHYALMSSRMKLRKNFKTYIAGVLQNSYGVSRYVAQKVTNYYIK
jgi:hypothetical protein